MIALLLSPLVPLLGVALVLGAGARVTARAVAIALGAWVVTGCIWFSVVGSLDIVALQGSVAAAATLVVVALWPGMHRLAITAWVLLVPLVVAFTTFDVIGGLLVRGLGYVDFGSASVLGVALGVTAIVLRRTAAAPAALGWRAAIGAGAAAVVGWLGLLVGAELTIDALTPVIVSVTAVSLVSGLVGWLGVELATARRVTPASIPAGLVAGGVVVAAGAPWLSVPFALVLGLLAGAVGAAFARRRVTAAGRLSAITLPAAVLGLIATGLLTSGPGWVNSGQPDLLFSELLGALVIAAWAAVVSMILALSLRRASPVD